MPFLPRPRPRICDRAEWLAGMSDARVPGAEAKVLSTSSAAPWVGWVFESHGVDS